MKPRLIVPSIIALFVLAWASLIAGILSLMSKFKN